MCVFVFVSLYALGYDKVDEFFRATVKNSFNVFIFYRKGISAIREATRSPASM